MKAERLRPDRVVAFDLETHLIQPGLSAPPVVCGSVAALEDGSPRGRLLSPAECRAWFEALMADDGWVIAGANVAFDMLCMAAEFAKRGRDVMPEIHGAYAAGRVFDVQLAETLHAIAEGTLGRDPRTGGPILNDRGRATNRYSLRNVCAIVLGRDDTKEHDRYRKSYALLEGVPMDEWPEDARRYPVDDAVNTLECAIAQMGGWAPGRPPAEHDGGAGPQSPIPSREWMDGTRRANRNLHLLSEQCHKAFALHLGGAWGLRADPVAVEELASAHAEAKEEGRPEHVAAGFVRDDGTECQSVVKRAVAIAYGCSGACERCAGSGKVPSTKTGKPVCCPPCNGTGLDLTTAPVPVTAPTEKGIAKAAASGDQAYGNVQIGRDILVESGDESLMAYAQWQEDDKIESTYLPFLRQGIDRPITLSPNAILDTLRVSYDGPVQLLPRQISPRLSARLRARGARVLGVRDAIAARPGRVFCSVDYAGGELVTFAEAAVARVGFSKMGEVLRAGADVHSLLGSQMLAISYDEFVGRLKKKKDPRCKAFRQAAKPINFGVPGSMGAVRIAMNQREQGPDTPHPSGPSLVWDGSTFVPGYKGLRFCILIGGADRCGAERITEYKGREYPPVCKECVAWAERLRDTAFGTWTELRPYLRWHSDNANDVGSVTHFMNGFVRGGVDYGSEANGDFQTGLAIITGRAQIRVSQEQYADPRSPLYGVSRSVVFAHDELFSEVVAERAHEVAMRVVEIMEDEFRKGCPNHAAACRAEPALAPRWWKAMEPVYHGGRLSPWTPDHDPKRCAECPS